MCVCVEDAFLRSEGCTFFFPMCVSPPSRTSFWCRERQLKIGKRVGLRRNFANKGGGYAFIHRRFYCSFYVGIYIFFPEKKKSRNIFIEFFFFRWFSFVCGQYSPWKSKEKKVYWRGMTYIIRAMRVLYWGSIIHFSYPPFSFWRSAGVDCLYGASLFCSSSSSFLCLWRIEILCGTRITIASTSVCYGLDMSPMSNQTKDFVSPTVL